MFELFITFRRYCVNISVCVHSFLIFSTYLFHLDENFIVRTSPTQHRTLLPGISTVDSSTVLTVAESVFVCIVCLMLLFVCSEMLLNRCLKITRTQLGAHANAMENGLAK